MIHNDIANIIKKTDVPVYVFDEEEFIKNYEELLCTFRKFYPKYNISYSYKTNYTPYVCQLVKSLGGYAEVVSDMEYELAKKIGYKSSMIVYNGPYKGTVLEEHLLNQGIVNIDNLEEVKQICKYSTRNPQAVFKVGIRINMNVGGAFISRFGFEPDSEMLNYAISLLKEQHNIQIVGLHCHISRARGIEAWAKRTKIMLEQADKLIDGVPQYISLGSGMFGKMSEELQKQFGDIPTYKDYAEAVLKPISEHYEAVEERDKPIIFTEPGTTLIAKYISFITQVTDIKQIRGRNIATVSGSFENLGEICTLKKLPFKRVKGGEKQFFYEAIDIMGYTCLEQDLMYEGYQGNLTVGDYIAFENVGGYSIVSKPQFIQPNCHMVVYKKSTSEIEKIMRNETFEDVFSKFVF